MRRAVLHGLLRGALDSISIGGPCGHRVPHMTEEQVREAGRRLAEAWLAARPMDAYPEAHRARSRADAYAIRDAIAFGD